MQMFIVNITNIMHSLMFCRFNQFDILVALKPQLGLQTSDHVDMDMENEEHWKWSDAEKPKTFWFWNAGILQGPFNLKSWNSGMLLKLTFPV